MNLRACALLVFRKSLILQGHSQPHTTCERAVTSCQSELCPAEAAIIRLCSRAACSAPVLGGLDCALFCLPSPCWCLTNENSVTARWPRSREAWLKLTRVLPPPNDSSGRSWGSDAAVRAECELMWARREQRGVFKAFFYQLRHQRWFLTYNSRYEPVCEPTMFEVPS